MLVAVHSIAKRALLTNSHYNSTRTLARVVPAPPIRTSLSDSSELKSTKPLKASNILRKKIPVKEDHGLYAFFRRKNDDSLSGEDKFEVVETPESMQKQTGRSWKALELRLKSFRDLHTLWYVLLRERNLLATQKEEARRMGISSPEMRVSSNRVHQVRKSMARIKAVLNERRLAFEGAVKLVEEEREQKRNQEVQNYLIGAWKERKYLQRRKEHQRRQLEKKRHAKMITTPNTIPAEQSSSRESQNSSNILNTNEVKIKLTV